MFCSLYDACKGNLSHNNTASLQAVDHRVLWLPEAAKTKILYTYTYITYSYIFKYMSVFTLDTFSLLNLSKLKMSYDLFVLFLIELSGSSDLEYVKKITEITK